MEKLKRTGNEKIIFSGKIFEIVRKQFRAGNSLVEFEIARRSPGVRLIIVKNDKILIVKEFRYELNGYDYRLPGGKVFDSLEEYKKFATNKKALMKHAVEAAKKECLEETGLIIKKIKHIHTSIAGLTIEWDLYYFVIDKFEESEDQKLGVGEIIHPQWKTFEEVKQLCLLNKIKEDRSVGVLLKFLAKI